MAYSMATSAASLAGLSGRNRGSLLAPLSCFGGGDDMEAATACFAGGRSRQARPMRWPSQSPIRAEIRRGEAFLAIVCRFMIAGRARKSLTELHRPLGEEAALHRGVRPLFDISIGSSALYSFEIRRAARPKMS